MSQSLVIFLHVWPLIFLGGIIVETKDAPWLVPILAGTIYGGLTSIFFTQGYPLSGRVFVILGVLALLTGLYSRWRNRECSS